MLGYRYKIIVKDKNGKVIKKIERKGHSFTGNFVKFLDAFFQCRTDIGEAIGMQIKNTDGNYDRIGGADYGGYNVKEAMPFRAVSGEDEFGIVVGTGTTPPDTTDYKLESQIPHGTGAGMLEYGEVYLEAMTDDKLYYSRTFTNHSGSTVTINELGIIVRNTYVDDGGTEHCNHFLIARDVLDTPIEVPDGGSIKVYYVFEVETP